MYSNNLVPVKYKGFPDFIVPEGTIVWGMAQTTPVKVRMVSEPCTIGCLSSDQVEALKTKMLIIPNFHFIGLVDVKTEHLSIGHNLVGEPVKLVKLAGFGTCYLKVRMTTNDFNYEVITKEIQLIRQV